MRGISTKELFSYTLLIFLILHELTACTSEIEETAIKSTRCEIIGYTESKCQLLRSDLNTRIVATDTIVRNTIRTSQEREVYTQEEINRIAEEEFTKYINNHISQRDNLLTSELYQPVLETLPSALYDIIMEAYVDENYDKFVTTCSIVLKDVIDKNIMDNSNISILSEELSALGKYREMVLNILVDFHYPSTRMSPGDRMIWQNCIHAMTKEQVKTFINVSIAGLFYTSGVKGVIGYLAGIGTSLW